MTKSDQYKFTQYELGLLSSKLGLEQLLMMDKPDYQKVVDQIKFEKKLSKLQAKLIKMQHWISSNNERVAILVEGREFAGKRNVIRRMVEHLNPREQRVVALQKPTKAERAQWYFKRYVAQIPERGEVVFFDRSWYNRAIIEPVYGFCTKEEYQRFMNEVNRFEEMLINDGVRMIKFYLSITKEEQQKRIDIVKNNPLRRWELTPVDLKAVQLWNSYTKYKNIMLDHTGPKLSPWNVIDANDPQKAVLQVIKKVLKFIPNHS